MNGEENKVAVRAAKALPLAVARHVKRFKQNCRKSVKDQIALTNLARQIGLLILEWADGQFTFAFFDGHKEELPKRLATYEQLNIFTSIARRLENPVKTIVEVRQVWQLDFQAAGLLTLPERMDEQPQLTTKYSDLLQRIGSTRSCLSSWVAEEPIEAWTADLRQMVRAQLKPIVEVYERLSPTPH